jgi:hypothetical protein
MRRLRPGYLTSITSGWIRRTPRAGSDTLANSRSATNPWVGQHEAQYDHNLYIQGYGIGANVFGKGEYLPVTAVFWWFAPNAEGVTYYNVHFLATLLAYGINVVWLAQVDSAPQAFHLPCRLDRKQVL